MPAMPLEEAGQDSAKTKPTPLDNPESSNDSEASGISDQSRTDLYDNFSEIGNAFKIDGAQSDNNQIELVNPFDADGEKTDDAKPGSDDGEPDGKIVFDNPFSVKQAAFDVAQTAKPADGQPEQTDQAVMAKEAASEADKPVKLDKVKFDESQVQEALDLAKKHKLPVAVYTGAEWCPACPSASEKFNGIASDMKGESETPAVLIKLDADNANRLKGQNTESGKALREFMGDANRIPNVAIYNPNDVTTPVADSTVAGWGKSSMESHMNKAFEKVRTDLGNERTGSSDSAESGASKVDFNESSIKDAVARAKEKGLPLITYVDKGNSDSSNINNALNYLNENGLAVGADISTEQSNQLLMNGLETSHYRALKSALNHKDQGANAKDSFFSSYDSGKIDASMQFSPESSVSPSDADQTIQFLKDSGVDLSEGNHEAAVRALLEGKPIPEEKASESLEEGQEDSSEEFESVYSVKTAEEASKVIELAKEKNLPLVTHAKTVICTDTSCAMEGLSPGAISAQEGNAIFMEIPRGGFKPEDIKGNKELEAINPLFKVSDDDHKTEIDINVFKFNEAKDDQMERETTAFQQNANINLYLSDLIK